MFKDFEIRLKYQCSAVGPIIVPGFWRQMWRNNLKPLHDKIVCFNSPQKKT